MTPKFLKRMLFDQSILSLFQQWYKMTHLFDPNNTHSSVIFFICKNEWLVVSLQPRKKGFTTVQAKCGHSECSLAYCHWPKAWVWWSQSAGDCQQSQHHDDWHSSWRANVHFPLAQAHHSRSGYLHSFSMFPWSQKTTTSFRNRCYQHYITYFLFYLPQIGFTNVKSMFEEVYKIIGKSFDEHLEKHDSNEVNDFMDAFINKMNSAEQVTPTLQ